MGGSLLRELRGKGTTDERPARSSARAKPARTRSKARPQRQAARTRAKAQPKRPAARTRANAQPRRPAARTRAKAQPRRPPGRKPLDDVTIARKVESTIFRGVDVDKGNVDVNVAEGVVWLRGEVRTPGLINELEARAARVTEVRRVENLLHLPEAPAPSRTDTPALQAETRGSAARPEDRPIVLGEIREDAAAPASDLGTSNLEAGGKGRGPAPVGSASRPADSAGGSPDRDESAGREHPDVAELDKDPDGDESAREGRDVAELDKDPDRNESAAPEGPDVAELDKDESAQEGRDVAELDKDPDRNESAAREGPDVAELDEAPASQPSDPGLRGLKGG